MWNEHLIECFLNRSQSSCSLQKLWLSSTGSRMSCFQILMPQNKSPESDAIIIAHPHNKFCHEICVIGMNFHRCKDLSKQTFQSNHHCNMHLIARHIIEKNAGINSFRLWIWHLAKHAYVFAGASWLKIEQELPPYFSRKWYGPDVHLHDLVCSPCSGSFYFFQNCWWCWHGRIHHCAVCKHGPCQSLLELVKGWEVSKCAGKYIDWNEEHRNQEHTHCSYPTRKRMQIFSYMQTKYVWSHQIWKLKRSVTSRQWSFIPVQVEARPEASFWKTIPRDLSL